MLNKIRQTIEKGTASQIKKETNEISKNTKEISQKKDAIMEIKTESRTKSLKEVEEVIAQAIKKVNGKKANDLCKYIPASKGGYLHHFTLKKMKTKEPEELEKLIKEFIINTDKVSSITPRQRAARGSKKKQDQFVFSRSQVDSIIQLARSSGNKEIISLLSQKKSITTCKKELIASIRQGKIEPELWNSYVEAIQNNTAADSAK
jgi:DNA-binding LytR/AlgR family response regulator